MDVITTTKALTAACQTLGAADFVSVDTEFMREQTFWPKLCLIQAATADNAFIIDPLSSDIDLAPFWRLMTGSNVVKVFHAARQDIEIIYFETGKVPSPVFDTQVAAMVCGFGDTVSYSNLVKKVVGATVDKSSRFTDWARRPLSEQQLAYALGDVTHLCNIYIALKNQLEASNRESWLDEEMANLTDADSYRLEPANAWKRLKLRVKNKKALAILVELAAWREQTAQARNVPRNRILRDDALYDIANQAPARVEQLASLRSLNGGFSRSNKAKEIIAAVQRGLQRDHSDLPLLRQAQPPSANALATLELLKVLLKSAAAKHGVAPRLIADSSELQAIASNDNPDVPALRGWRRQLFGEDALRLKRGELALTLSGGDIRLIPTHLK